MCNSFHSPVWYDVSADPTGFVLGLICYMEGEHGDAQELAEFHERMSLLAWERDANRTW